MNIELASVLLRALEPGDGEAICRFRNDPEVRALLGGFSTSMSRQAALDWINLHRQKHDEVLWAIADKSNDACLGHVGLYRIDYRLQLAEFGICFGTKQHWGKGLGAEITRAVLRFGFDELNLEQVRLEVLETNSRAVRLYERLGFRHDGRFRRNQFRNGRFVDSLLMSLLRSEWNASGPSS
jgi:[ribosomal protein S5]-alanine N-acetyltransferase